MSATGLLRLIVSALVLLDGCRSLRLNAHASLSRSMRASHARAAVGLAADDDDAGLRSAMGSFFKLNRDTPEAQKNQIEWARQQMDFEVPEETVDGKKIAGREDMIAQYIESEKAKFSREIDYATAEKEVDAWLLKQATNAPNQTSTTDLVVAAAVFIAAFSAGLYFAQPQ